MFRGYNTVRDQQIRELLIDKLGGKCVICNFSDSRALQFDHKNGGGWKRDGKILGTSVRHKIILTSLELFQLLCANCNQIKKHENKEHGNRWEEYTPTRLATKKQIAKKYVKLLK